ncbi:MAG: sigma-70 family RNA polymerase sigma factor [Clostridia bacterium]|nr:sigma-70 family RNA polymerase sigma factor [Clostridia bacterium]
MDNELTDLLTSQIECLYRFAYNRLHDEAAAEDLTQDIVECALRSYHKIDDPDRRIPWLWGIARNVYLRTVTAKSRRETAEDTENVIKIIDSAGISYETPETALIQREECANLRRAVSYLSKMYRDVCVMHWLEEKDYNTIAEELGIPLSSVKWRLNQSKVRLKEELMKMDYMENGYRRAVKLYMNMGGYVEWSGELGNYDGADEALHPLLAQNICISAYESPKTVTEIASDIGCAADYIEDSLAELVKCQCVKQTKDKYRTMFPVWSREVYDEVFKNGFDLCLTHADNILDTLYSLADEIRAVGFTGADKPFEKLLPMLLVVLSRETENDFFDTANLPFESHIESEKRWYILGFTGRTEYENYCFGINSAGGMGGDLVEYYIASEFTKEARLFNQDLYRAVAEFCLTGKHPEDYLCAKLMENGRLRKNGDTYEINVSRSSVTNAANTRNSLRSSHPSANLSQNSRTNCTSVPAHS